MWLILSIDNKKFFFQCTYVNLVDDIKATTICLLRNCTQENFVLPGVPRAFISRDFSAGTDPISCSHASANSEQIFFSDNGRGFFFYAKVNCLYLDFMMHCKHLCIHISAKMLV